MPERRSLINVISNNPTLAKSWQPEAIAHKQEQIQEQVSTSAEIQVPLSTIHLSFSFTPSQSPLRYHYDPEQIAQWAEADIKPNGILSPLWVRRLPEHNGAPAYELIAGMRRYLAAQHLQLKTVPVKVFDWEDEQAYQAAASENFNRKGFSPIEELDHILHFLSRALDLTIDQVPPLLNRMSNAAKGNVDPAFLESEPAQTVQQVFAALGQMSWKTFVQSRLRLRNQPPDVIAAIREGRLSYPKAMAIATVKDTAMRTNLIQRAVADNLTLDAITIQAGQLKQATGEPRSSATDLDDPQATFKQLCRQLNQDRTFWKDPKRVKKLQKYLEAIRALLNEEP